LKATKKTEFWYCS